MSSAKFTVATEILVTITQQGSMSATVQGVKAVGAASQSSAGQLKNFNKQSQSQSYLIRRLAMDLRMLSIGLGVLKREFGGINPVIDASISGLYKASAAMSVILGGAGALTNTYKLLAASTNTTGQGVGALTTALTAGTAGLMAWAAAAVIAVGVGIAVGTANFEMQTGISSLRTEITGLETDLEGMASALRNVNVESANLGAISSKNRYIIAALKREIELTGDPTGQLATQLKAVTAQQDDGAVAAAYNAWQTANMGAEMLRTKDRAADLGEQIDVIYDAGLERLGGAFSGVSSYQRRGQLSEQYSGNQLGGEVRRGGLVGVEAGEVIMQREQSALMMGQGGGGNQVSISLAGANIYGITNLEDAMRRGGRAAAKELDLYRRKVRSRY